MALHVIKMPDVGEGITEAEVVEWNVAVGDFVREDDILGAVMTDKASVEIPSPVTGVVASIRGEIGTMTAVGAEIIAIKLDEDVASGSGNDQLDEPVGSVETNEGTMPDNESVEGEEIVVSPAALDRTGGAGVMAAPAVRRRARKLGIELADVTASGALGHILHEDLDRHLVRDQVPVVSKTISAADSPAPVVPETEKMEVIEWPVIGLRRTIAQRMEEAKRRIPHITYVEEVDVTELEALRVQLNETADDGQDKLTILPFLMVAMVKSAGKVPKISAHYNDEDNRVTQFEAMHIGMATQTDGGLMVPVVRHAEGKDIWDLASEIRRLADCARDGSIKRDELTGSSITISSLGPMGGIVSTPVINAPEVAIVGVNKIVMRPTYMGDQLVPRKIMNLSSSFDHRIIDGWDAATFIQEIKRLLEHPAMLFME